MYENSCISLQLAMSCMRCQTLELWWESIIGQTNRYEPSWAGVSAPYESHTV